MRDYVNPLLMFSIIGLFAWAISDADIADSAWLQPGLWLLTLCATGCLVNGALCFARGLAHRPVLSGAVWSMVHLLLGCCAWVWLSQDSNVNRAELEKYRHLVAQQGLSPYAMDEEGDSLLSLAAGLGKDAVVRRILTGHPHGKAEEAALTHAAWHAAQNGRNQALSHLLEAGVSPDADVADTPLIIAAVNSRHCKAVIALTEKGADVNRTDIDGNTPFIHAVINGDIATARYLREHGADPNKMNKGGRRAADFSRSDRLDELMK